MPQPRSNDSNGYAIVLSVSVTRSAEARAAVRDGLPLYGRRRRQLPLVANALYCCTGASKTGPFFELISSPQANK